MRPDIRYTPRPQWSTDDVTEVGLVELVYEENNQSLQATLLISFLDRTSDFSELYIYIYILAMLPPSFSSSERSKLAQSLKKTSLLHCTALELAFLKKT